MRELFRHRDHTLVAFYGEMLEAEGIPIMFRNLHLAMGGLSEIPITEFYPNICVMNDDDYPRAWEVMRRLMHDNAAGSDREINCGACGEVNPGNFEMCFACGGELKGGGESGRDLGGGDGAG